MIFPHGDLFRALRPHLTPLLSQDAAGHVQSLTDRLPPAFTWGGLELRLKCGDEQVDYGACAAAWEDCRPALAAALAHTSHRASFGALRPLLDAWARAEGGMSDVTHLWLEYDQAGREAGGSDPVVFIAVDPESRNVGHRREIPLSHALRLASEGLTLALGKAPDPAIFETYSRCSYLLPPGGRVMSVAPLQTRGRDELRMDVSLPHDSIGPWLSAIGWPGDRRARDRLFALIGSGWSRNNVELDIGHAVGPALGFLYHPIGVQQQTEKWLPFIRRLGDAGLCDRERGEAICRWPGSETVQLPGAEWHVRILRDLGFKVEVRNDGELRAKAYLCYWSSFTLI